MYISQNCSQRFNVSFNLSVLTTPTLAWCKLQSSLVSNRNLNLV